MKNFDWASFTIRIEIKSELSEVYNAWTVSNKLENWFLSKARFFSPENKQLHGNTPCYAKCEYKWHWFAQERPETGEVLTANGKDFIEFTFAGNCKVKIKMEPVDDVVVVELSQSEIPLDEDAKLNIRLGCYSGWSFYLVNLKSFLEGGIDLRNKKPCKLAMINN